MRHALIDREVIDEPPNQYLRAVGAVFAEFGELTQDSGNVSYGVEVARNRYFVKTAGNPDNPRSALDHQARGALLRNAVRLYQSFRHPLPAIFAAVLRTEEAVRGTVTLALTQSAV